MDHYILKFDIPVDNEAAYLGTVALENLSCNFMDNGEWNIVIFSLEQFF